MSWRAATVTRVPEAERTKTGPPRRETVLFDTQAPFRRAGGTMARGEKRVFSPFFLAGRLVGGATGLSRSGGEGQ